MKFNLTYKCELCGTITQPMNIIVDVPDDKLNDEAYSYAVFSEMRGDIKGKLSTSFIVHVCGNGRIGCANFSGIAPAGETKEEGEDKA